jgi:hypothetical protein
MRYIVHTISDSMIYIYTKFHEDWFRNADNIKVITSPTKVVVVLVLLMTGIS